MQLGHAISEPMWGFKYTHSVFMVFDKKSDTKRYIYFPSFRLIGSSHDYYIITKGISDKGCI